MKVLELFSGSGSISKAFKEAGHKTLTIDIDPKMEADIVCDMLDLSIDMLPERPDVIWASPPCTTFSVASIGTHWNPGYEPKTDECKKALAILDHTIRIISESNCKYWYIENPRGVMRKVIDRLLAKHGLQTIKRQVIRHTVTYCQYGDKRMKPTDIWTNNPHWKPRPKCKNGSKCHEAAPRGSKTGTQGLKDAYERGKLPKQLCEEIVKTSMINTYCRHCNSNPCQCDSGEGGYF